MMDIEIKPQPLSKKQLEKIRDALRSGRIRRFGAIVNHQKLKFNHNALIAWKKKAVSLTLSRELKAKVYISHIYQRKSVPLWPYGLYTMIHARSQKELNSRTQELSKLMSGCGFKVLRTLREFKKTSFNPDFGIKRLATKKVGFKKNL